MDNGELHPNWRVLSTAYINYKVFVTAGSQPEEDKKKDKFCVNNKINAEEITQFYNDILQTPETPKLVREKLNEPELKVEKLKFDKKKFFYAAMTNDTTLLYKFCYENNVINSIDNFGWTALMMAACEGNLESVKFLLSKDANKNICDRSGNNALSLAKLKGYDNIVKALTDKVIEKSTKLSPHNSKNAENFLKYSCSICNGKFSCKSKKEHITSTLHLFNRNSFVKRKRFNISNKNVGLKLMVKQGWDKESGLGPNGSGHLYPLKTTIRKDRTGLGIEQTAPKVTHFKPYDMAAIKYKQPPPRSKTKKEILNQQKRDKQKEKYYRQILS